MWLNISIFVKILGSSEHCIRWKSFSVFMQNLDFWWRSMTSDPKFSLWSGYRATMGGCKQNVSLLSQFLEPNATCKIWSHKVSNRPPPRLLNKNPDFFQKLLPPKFIKLKQNMFWHFNTKGWHHPENLCSMHLSILVLQLLHVLPYCTL